MGKKDARSSWGSIRQRDKNVWQIRYTVAGRPKSETVRGTEKDAERRKAELWVEYGDCEAPDPEVPVRLADFWNDTYEPWMRSCLAPKTCENYVSMWFRHILPAFGSKELQDIRSADVQAWLLEMTHATARHAKVTLASILSRVRVLDQVDDNVAQRRFQMPDKATSRRIDKSVYSKAELEEIAEACRGETFEGAFLFAGFGGDQRSEICGVWLAEIEDVDGYAVAPVNRSVHYTEREVRVKESAKNDYRETFLIVEPPHAARVFELRDEGLARGEVWLCDDGFGNPVNPAWVSEAYKRWFATQPYKYIPFLNLRASYATWMRDEGHDADDVASLMRHASTDMLKKVYDRPDARGLIRRLCGGGSKS